jgi:hypothetical protein
VVIQKPECANPEFLCFYLNSLAAAHVEAGSVGVALTHFNTMSVANMPLALPPLAEQRRIVAKVDALMALCDRLEASLTAAAATRRRLLDALLAEALAPAEDRCSICSIRPHWLMISARLEVDTSTIRRWIYADSGAGTGCGGTEMLYFLTGLRRAPLIVCSPARPESERRVPFSPAHGLQPPIAGLLSPFATPRVRACCEVVCRHTPGIQQRSKLATVRQRDRLVEMSRPIGHNVSPKSAHRGTCHDVHEFTANRRSSYSVNDLKGQQPFTAGDERLLLATDNSAELLYFAGGEDRCLAQRNARS